MLYTERFITVNKGTALIDEPVLLYKGDKNVEIQFNIKNSPFKYKSSADLTYGQLVIQRKNAESIFSPVAQLSGGKIIFVITGEMIDEINEIGKYTFQIRLFNADKTSRATLPVITDGIEVKQPICDGEEPAMADLATVNDAFATGDELEDVFDQDGNYLETNWESGMVISTGKLNKIENAIDHINENYATKAEIPEIPDMDNLASKDYVDNAIENIDIPEVDLSNYATKDDIGDINAILDAINGEVI